MSLHPTILARLTTPKPHRKGATEEHIFADNQKVKTLAKLMSELSLRRSINSQEGR